MMRVTSVPDRVVAGAVMVTVPFTLSPVLSDKLVGKVEGKAWLLVARMVKFPPAPLVIIVKGTESGASGTKMLSTSAYR